MKRILTSLLSALVLWQVSASAEDIVQVYELALENDARLRAARASRDAVMEARPQAKAQLLPFLGLGADVRRTHVDFKDAEETDTTRSGLALSLQQSVYNRAYWVQLEQADALIARAQAEYASEEQTLIRRVARAYFDVLSAQDSLEFAQAESKAIERQLDQAQQRIEVGLIAITDVLDAQAAYDQSRADLIRAENDVDLAWEALHEITRVPVSALSPMREEIPLQPPTPADIEQWNTTAQEQNLAIQAARYRAEVAKQNIEVQRSGHYPTLDLVGGYALDREDDTVPGADRDTASIGLQFDLPLYTGGATTSRTRQAGYEFEAAQETLDQQRRATSRQVRDAYRTVVASISAVEALKALRRSAESALEATEAGYEVGTRTLVDVLNAQRDLYSARSNYAQVRYVYILNGLSLREASGVLEPADLERVNALLQD